MSDSLFHWTRTPDPAWERSLALIAPRRDRASHLTIRWVPVHDLRLAQRWVIFECVPFAYVAHLNHITNHLWSNQPDPMLWWARDYLRATDCLPVPAWVCQGGPVGHPYSYNAREKALANAGRLPPNPPPIGFLPYAEPTDLTFRALSRRSTLGRRMQDAWKQRMMEQEQARRAMRQTIANEVDEDMRALMDEHGKSIYEHEAKTVSSTSISKANVTDDAFDEYIQTGALPLPRPMTS